MHNREDEFKLKEPPATPTTTEGQWRVGVNFNPSQNPDVDSAKNASAALIDKCLEIASDRSHPGARNAAIAATEYENAAMNLVKAITKQPR